MEFRILGPLEVVLDGRAVELRAAKVRALLGMLLLSPNQVVAADRLADGLWGDDRPYSAVNTLQGYVSQLRKALGGDGIQTRSPGYVLAVDDHHIDAVRFERLLGEGRRARTSGNPNRAVTVLARALELWRGEALTDFTYAEWAQTAIARLQEQRLVATEEWIEARLELGEHSEVLAELDGLVAAHPLRERLWAARILALYRSGRQADALRAYQNLRQTLGDELGIAPSPALVALEESVLRRIAGLRRVDIRVRGRPAGTARTAGCHASAASDGGSQAHRETASARSPKEGDIQERAGDEGRTTEVKALSQCARPASARIVSERRLSDVSAHRCDASGP